MNNFDIVNPKAFLRSMPQFINFGSADSLPYRLLIWVMYFCFELSKRK